jgi:hypothetical protein
MRRRIIGFMTVSRVVSVVLGVSLVLHLLPLDGPAIRSFSCSYYSFCTSHLSHATTFFLSHICPFLASVLFPFFVFVIIQALYDSYIDNTTTHS